MIQRLQVMLQSMANRVGEVRREEGLSTAELLGNAALAIAALVVIWGLLQALGVDVVDWIRTKILDG
ncbi:MAG: hypothetical protein OEX97_14165 [Acidimicrobiia bacterium]|nr:hypothetical protein [Acidimicrobiia bacterium]